MGEQSVSAACPCGATLELSREGIQTTTIKGLLAFLEVHRGCRSKGDVVIREGE
jgi:hypothetical protein